MTDKSRFLKKLGNGESKNIQQTSILEKIRGKKRRPKSSAPGTISQTKTSKIDRPKGSASLDYYTQYPTRTDT